eukprot:CAMPEP_0197246174 /NCGR_PEP_ID=MMETSP1429-20130617/10709_1 /TAXON_ID=49237 /ORGANISM="Chaetoceros  sp., Strain UNC1202" /LENGTH=698 /DNA_ID=CAMNT_0042706785 /DNA_START=89 /DNA_END=2185 /DNA_ORIENTATION=-
MRFHLSAAFLITRATAFQLMTSTNIARGAATRLAAVAIESPFGSWESPITSKAITAGSVNIGNLNICENDLYWTEGRPKESGRNVLCRYAPDADGKSDRDAVDVSPADTNIRTLVHEYGGRALVFGKSRDEIYFSNFQDQQICKLFDNQKMSSITQPDGRFRYADGVLSANGDYMYCVREDHDKPAPKDVVNEIVSIKLSDGTMKVLATGNDFYAAPRLSSDNKKLVYITWNHPNMPWDASKLYVVDLEEDESVSNISNDHELIAGADDDTSVMQPLWHPSGDLFYISDQDGYWNIYKTGYDEASIIPMKTDLGGPSPGWVLGQQGFDFLPDGRLVAQYEKAGKSIMLIATVTGDGPASDVEEYGMEDGLPMKFNSVIGTESNDFYFMGGSPSTPKSVYKWNLEKKNPAEIIACSSKSSFPDSVVSIPKQIEFPTTLGTAFGYFYPPKNDRYKSTGGEKPPLLVKAHGGPTSCAGTDFNPKIQFWTSRGFAVLDVDYGGSTGYGREYRRRLRDSWGIVDIDDVCAGAKSLVEQGLVDGERLCIDGGSAGGYTTLGALAFRDVFKAGCSLYGIGDLTALAGDTHKFESRYLDGLVGPYPEKQEIYEERSPIESVDTLNCPILLLQGKEDKVVPPNQAIKMHEALLKKNIPTCLKIYEGEEHGFRKAENIEDALDTELAFYGRVFEIDVPDAIQIDIDNM